MPYAFSYTTAPSRRIGSPFPLPRWCSLEGPRGESILPQAGDRVTPPQRSTSLLRVEGVRVSLYEEPA
jgi:hypothetical protein